jgi:histidine triad (HIT) family protein
VLILPKRHIATLNDLTPEDDRLVGSMVRAAAAIAGRHGYAERGYRTVFNCNHEAGQTVFHIHLHLLAGRGLHWPPG